jgi:hypothetical protein
MKNSISKVLLIVTIFAFFSCSDDDGPQLIENSNNERHVFVLEQGQSFDYDLAKTDFETSSDTINKDVKVFRLTSTSVGSSVNIDGKQAFVINDSEFLEYSIFSNAKYFYSDDNSLEIYTESILDLANLNSNDDAYYPLRGKWLKIIDFKEKEWTSVDTKDTINLNLRTYERKYEVTGKRINVTEVTYDGKVFDALNIDIVYKHELKLINSSERPIVRQVQTNILSIGELGIYQLKTSSGIIANEFYYSILSDND